MRFYFLLFIITFLFFSCSNPENPVQCKKQVPLPAKTLDYKILFDSRMTFEEAISGTEAPREIIDQLVLIDVDYYSTDNRLHRGQILLNQSMEKDIKEIFKLIKEIRFPVQQVTPVVAYSWNDNLSMAANNTYSFCYRKVAGSNNYSRHATGRAIDINPLFNPLVWKSPNEDKPNSPRGTTYDINRPGTLYPDHPVVKAFKSKKFTWGYNFSKYKDIHHFHKD